MTRAGLQVKSDSDWRISADNSLLRRGTVAWMPDAETWLNDLSKGFLKPLVNPLRNDGNAVEVWSIWSAEPMEWYRPIFGCHLNVSGR